MTEGGRESQNNHTELRKTRGTGPPPIGYTFGGRGQDMNQTDTSRDSIYRRARRRRVFLSPVVALAGARCKAGVPTYLEGGIA